MEMEYKGIKINHNKFEALNRQRTEIEINEALDIKCSFNGLPLENIVILNGVKIDMQCIAYKEKFATDIKIQVIATNKYNNSFTTYRYFTLEQFKNLDILEFIVEISNILNDIVGIEV